MKLIEAWKSAKAVSRVAVTGENAVKLSNTPTDIQSAIKELAPKMKDLFDSFKEKGFRINYQIEKWVDK